MKQAIIIAGGMGTRLKARLGDLPKPMIPIGGKPLMEHQVELAKRHGFTEIVIFACYRPDLIQAHLGDGSRWGVKISYEIEKTPLGTAGAVLAGMRLLAERFLVFYGDTMVNVDLGRIWARHVASGAGATLLLHPNDHPLDSDLVEMDEADWVTAFHNRPHPAGKYFQNLVNAGLYVVEKAALAPWASDVKPMDFGKDLFPAMLRAGQQLLGYNTPEYIKDIGTPERYDRVSAEYASGVIARSSLQTPQPTVFLDRDGTLNREVDGVTSPEKLELLPGVAEGIYKLNRSGIRAVVISNQPIIAKGFCTRGRRAGGAQQAGDVAGRGTCISRSHLLLPAPSGERLRGRARGIENRVRLPEAGHWNDSARGAGFECRLKAIVAHWRYNDGFANGEERGAQVDPRPHRLRG